MAKPVDASIRRRLPHRIHPLKEQLSCQCQRLGHVLRLELAQLDENRRIGNVDHRRIGQAEHGSKHDLDDLMADWHLFCI